MTQREEYWILDKATFCYEGIDNLYYDLENETPPRWNLSKEAILPALINLFEREEILAHKFEDGQITAPFMPSREEVELDLEGKMTGGMGYRLTEKGGMRWAQMSEVDWQKFRRAYHDDEGIHYVIVRGLDKDNMMTYLQYYHPYIWDGSYPILGTETWTVLEPFEAIYWKTFPRGYELQCNIRRVKPEGDILNDEAYIEAYKKAEYEASWHKNYLELNP